jgi:hypothetical protein
MKDNTEKDKVTQNNYSPYNFYRVILFKKVSKIPIVYRYGFIILRIFK